MGLLQLALMTFSSSHWSGAFSSAQQPSPIGWILDAQALSENPGPPGPAAGVRERRGQWQTLFGELGSESQPRLVKHFSLVRGLWLKNVRTCPLGGFDFHLCS